MPKPARRVTFYGRRQFLWKTLLLLATTLALVPILVLQDAGWAKVYLVCLALVHVAGIAVIAAGTTRQQIAPDRRGLVIRLIGIGLLVGLLLLAKDGLDSSVGSGIFWSALFAIWALHTLGLALLHIRSGREAAACPFA